MHENLRRGEQHDSAASHQPLRGVSGESHHNILSAFCNKEKKGGYTLLAFLLLFDKFLLTESFRTPSF